MKIYATTRYLLCRLESEGFQKEASTIREALQKEAVMDESKLNQILRMDVSELPSTIRDKIIGWFSNLGGGEKEDVGTPVQQIAARLRPAIKGLDERRRIETINNFFKSNKSLESYKMLVLRELGLIGK